MVNEVVLPKLIVGLGNPGEKYQGTRHNAGFAVIDRLLEKIGPPQSSCRKYQSEVVWVRYAGQELCLMKPLTYMNASGEAVGPMQRELGVLPQEILVIYDCLDLPLGRLRLRRAGSSGGHHGMDSVIGSLGTQGFLRMRVGIGSPQQSGVIDYVLSPWSVDEKVLVSEVFDTAAEAVLVATRLGFGQAMNRYNGWNSGVGSGSTAANKENEN
jgi:PTH1 family peptidyl-tRNA hydrolase